MTLAKWVTTVVVGITLSAAAGASGRSQTSSTSAPTRSRVSRLEITSRRSAFGGKSFGTAGPYEIIVGRAHAFADPKAAPNAVIVDIDKAPRDVMGLIEYSFDVQILKPVDLQKGNGVLLYEVSNRGRGQLYAALNDGGLGYEANNAGNGFIMNAGYTYVMSGWSSGAASPGQVWADLPIATNNGQSITGPSMEEWMEPGSGGFGRLSYPAATLDQTKAKLTYREHQDDPRQTLPASQWSYVNDTAIKVTPPAGTDAGTLYEFVYEAKNPVVQGLGFAAIRDFVSFIRHSPADDAGTSNPLFVNGRPVLNIAVAVGLSQSGRAMRDLVYLGFNQDIAGRKVFDAMSGVVVGARRTFTNYRFAQPGRYTRQHEDHFYPTSGFPFTFAATTDHLTGKTDGLFLKCSASNTCPNFIQVDSYTELYGAHDSLIMTDTRGKPLQLPANVRLYLLTLAHLQGNEGCVDPANTVSPNPYYRAAVQTTLRWVRDGVVPPPTRTPSAADGTLVTVAEQGKNYPTIPERAFNPKINEVGPRDYSSLPPKETGKYTTLVPKLDRDGNMVAGVIVPEVAVPLATYGKAVRKPGFGEGDVCHENGSAIPFAKTKAERLARGDSRLSIEERYPDGQAEYAARYAAAVDKLVSDGYLLEMDAGKLKASGSRF
jgi:alpha/beta hydrolase family protein